MSRDVIQQLKELKHRPEAGWVRASQVGSSRDALMQAIGHQEEIASVEQPSELFSFYRFAVSHFVFTPTTITASVFVMVLGGWITTVNAAGSLPGDTLYGLKLVSERAQLSIASLEHKAVLHTAFAGRRLEEAVVLGTSTDLSKLSFVGVTLDAYSRELTAAEENLRQLQEEGNEETVQVASAVDKKIDHLSDSIEKDFTEESPERDGARDATKRTSNSVIDVVVETHESAVDQTASERDLHVLFKNRLEDIRNREALDLGRLVVIEQVADANDLDIPSMNDVQLSIKEAMETVSDAERLAAVGGYRAAFEILRSIEDTLEIAERSIAEVEILIVDQFATMLQEEQDATAAEGIQQDESTNDSLTSEDT